MNKNEYSRRDVQILKASALASILSTVITNPIEVAKLNIQYFPLNCKYYPHKSYLQLIRCECSKISIVGSIKSLKIAVPQILFSNIIFMQFYEQLRQYFLRHTSLSSASTILASLTGRCIVTTLSIPFESLRIRLSNEISNTKLNLNGYKITLLRDLSFSVLYWSILEAYRNKRAKGQYRHTIPLSDNFSWQIFAYNMVPGFVVGGFVAAITTPLDTLKTRVQSQGISSYSIITEIGQIFKKEGLTGLFSGVQWRMLKSGFHSSLYLYIYERYMAHVSQKDMLINGLEE